MGITLCVVGLGLIGGSLAIDLQRCAFASRVIGVDNNVAHQEEALKLGLVDEIMTVEEAVWLSDLLVLAIPVNAIIKTLPKVLDLVSKDTVVTDVGSTKNPIVEVIKGHSKRSRYVASHPMAGTEYSGPNAAVKNLFQEKVSIICNREDSDKQAVDLVERMYRALYMDLLYMDAKEHDVHAAYVSHISHISSFVLANTVLEKEKSTKTIFDLASGGFQSTVRLAKSSPEMWTPIFMQNSENLLEVLDTYLEQMQEFRDLIAKGDRVKLKECMEQANRIRKVLG